MYQIIVTIVIILLWVCHGWILYTIDQFCEHRLGHTSRNGLESATRTTQLSSQEGTPRHDQKIDLVSQPEIRQSTSLNSDCPHSCTNYENIEIHHSTATDKQLTNENADLKEQVASSREIKSKLMNDKEISKSKLLSLESENRTIMDAKEAAEQSAKQAEVLFDEQLKIVERLNFDLDLANAFIDERGCIIDQLNNELSELQRRNTVLDRQNKEMKIDIEKLNGSIRKRDFDSKSSKMILNTQNEELKKKMDHLLTQNRTLSETKSQLRTELKFANAEIVNLRKTVTEKEQESIEFRKETEILRAESERVMESCKAASFSPDQAAKSVEQQRALTHQSLLAEFDPLSKMTLNAQNEEPKKKMDHLLTQNRTLSETNSQLRTELEFANAQIVNMRKTMTEKEQELVEFRKETEILRAESEKMMGSCKVASFSPDQAAKSVEQQRASTQQSLLAEFDPPTYDIPVRFPRSNWVSDFDLIDPLKEEIHELNARLRYLELLNETLTSKIEEDTMVEEELWQTIGELEKQNHLLVRLVSTNPAQLPNRATTKHKTVLYETLDSSEQPVCYENEVAEEEEIGKFGTDVTQKNENLVKKKNGSRFKRCLSKREFGKQKAKQDNDMVNLMKGTTKVVIKKAKKLKEKAKDLLRT